MPGTRPVRQPGTPPDTAALREETGKPSQQILDLRRTLEERDEELTASREIPLVVISYQKLG